MSLKPRGIPSWAIALLLVAAAALLRFHKIGDWPFSGDEVATLQETRAFFDPSSAPADSQIFRLPRVIPASYLINEVGYSLFGWNEFGSRVFPALAGIALVGASFLLGQLVFGRRTAVILGLLVALSPPHVLHSQTNRFYSLTALFAGLTMLLGGVAATRPGVMWTVLAAVSVALSALTHTVSVVLVLLIGAGILLTRYAETRAVSRGVVSVLGVTALALGALLLYVRPLLQAWNDGVGWRYSPAHSMLASVNMLGWPMALLAGLGVVLMFEDRAKPRWYWMSCLGGFAGVTVTLPYVAVYQPWYAFPFALGALVFAAYAISDIYGRLHSARPTVAALWVLAALAMNLPALASHFVDGSRTDMRTAVAHVSTHWEFNDRIAAVPFRPLRYYAPELEPAVLIPRANEGAEVLEKLAAIGGRLWVVIDSGRGGLPAAVQQWLSANASHRLHVSRQRFDYFEYSVDVFLVVSRDRAAMSPTP